MKPNRTILTALCLCALTGGLPVFAQTTPGTSALPMGDMISTDFLNTYSPMLTSNSTGRVTLKYTRASSDDDYEKIAKIGGAETDIDTMEEILYLSYSAGVVNIRPTEAKDMLPKNHDSDLKVAALMYQNMQALNFVNPRSSSASVTATLFNEFCQANGLSRAEVQAFFNRNIGALISAEVDAQFNRVSFLLETDLRYMRDNKKYALSYNSQLIRNPNTGQYTLEYSTVNLNRTYWGLDVGPSPWGEMETRKVTGATLEALLTGMRNAKLNNIPDFDQTGINQVRAQAALIPAVVFARNNNGSMQVMKDILENFYKAPNTETYNAVKDVYVLYYMIATEKSNEFFGILADTYAKTLTSLSDGLARKVFVDITGRNVVTLPRAQQEQLTSLSSQYK